jgi:RNAse (barnase) inhibitor barstar
LRWLLVDDFAMGQPDSAVAVCADIDGVFADPPGPPPVGRFTAVGCAPAGRLAAACAAPGPVWLGNIFLDIVHGADEPLGAHCDRSEDGCAARTAELLDATVTGCRPSTAAGLVEVTIEGRLDLYGLCDGGSAARYVLTADGSEHLGRCRDMTGIDRARPEPIRGPAVLLGCRPEPPLRRALDALARGAGNPGGALHRRRIDAVLHSVAADGTARSVGGAAVHGSVTGSRPSALGDGLIDVTFDTPVDMPMSRAARPIWELWRAGGPAEPGLWAGYDRDLRRQWLSAAMTYRRHGAPDRPAGTEYHLDGRHVTDVEGFYCAIGEAINGPGGYFGWNADALRDCLLGGWGATRPSRLVWHDSAVARSHLVPGYDRFRWAPAITMDQLVEWLTDAGFHVDPR